jgi:hypothetical protein
MRRWVSAMSMMSRVSDDELILFEEHEAVAALIASARARSAQPVDAVEVRIFGWFVLFIGGVQIAMLTDGVAFGLLYKRCRWPHPRLLRFDSFDAMREGAIKMFSERGPFGGPDLYEPETRRMPVIQFRRCYSAPGSLFAHFGRGYEVCVFPVIRGAFGAVVVSPDGSFVIVGFGISENLCLHADWLARNFHEKERLNLDEGLFYVRIRGQPYRFTYRPLPGVLGGVKTSIGELFLFVSEDLDVVIVCEDADTKNVTVLEKAPFLALCGKELFPGEVSSLLAAPAKFGCEQIQEALGRVTSISAGVREGLLRQIPTASDNPGMETVRRLLWAFVAAHFAGQRERLVGTTEVIFQWFLDRGHLEKMPCDRARREALRWLHEKTGFATRPRDRSPIWTLHFSRLKAPSEEVIRKLDLKAPPRGSW